MPVNFENKSIFSLDAKEIELSVAEIMDITGNNQANQNEYFESLAQQMLTHAESALHFQAFIEIYPIQIIGDTLFVEGKEMVLGKKLCSHFKGAEYGAFFIATAGPNFEKITTDYTSKGLLLEAYYLDILGSMMVEKGMDAIQKRFFETAKNGGLKATNRYSPGYCDWLVSDQFKLFQLLEHTNNVVTLSENALMSPIKSISGMIGLGTDVKFIKHRCDLCNSHNCIYKNKGHKFTS